MELTVRGTARVSFDTTVEVDVDEEVSNLLEGELPSFASLEDVEVDDIFVL